MFLKVLIVEPGKVPYEKNIKNNLNTMQKIVGGMIQITYPYDDLVGIVCNEEGKIMELPLNRYIPESEDIIAGTFFVCGLSETDLASLDREQIEKFYNKFKCPEQFMIGREGVGIIKHPAPDYREVCKLKNKNMDRGR